MRPPHRRFGYHGSPRFCRSRPHRHGKTERFSLAKDVQLFHFVAAQLGLVRVPFSAQRRLLAHLKAAGIEAQIGDLFSRSFALYLENDGRQRFIFAAAVGGEEGGNTRQQFGDAHAGHRRAKEDRVEFGDFDLAGQRVADELRFIQRFTVDIGCQERSSCWASRSIADFDKGWIEGDVEAVGDNRCLFCAEIFGCVEWQHTLAQLFFDLLDKGCDCAPTRSILLIKRIVGMPSCTQNRHEKLGLRLDAFDGGDDEDRTIEHAKGALDFSDKVGVTGGIDQVDFDVPNGKRDNRGFDGDAASSFQIQRIGLRGRLDRHDRSSSMTLVSKRMRSVRLVLPASTWATMPIFTIFIKKNPLGTYFLHFNLQWCEWLMIDRLSH